MTSAPWTDARCNVCGTSGPVITACSSLGAFSVAFCRECLACGAEPCSSCVALIADVGGTFEALAEWAHEIIFVSCLRASKTAEEFWVDVAHAKARLDTMDGAE